MSDLAPPLASAQLEVANCDFKLAGLVDSQVPSHPASPEVVTRCNHLREGNPMMKSLVPAARIERAILVIRGQRVMVDADLAELYGVSTKRLNEQVKRNASRFPADFAFALTAEEKAEVVANCDHLARLKFSPTFPRAFTEHGALMLASVLNSETAIAVSVAVVRAFVRLREMAASHEDLARKLDALERKYDESFRIVFTAIRKMMVLEAKPRRRIGFGSKPHGE